jgi:hypothetical protein
MEQSILELIKDIENLISFYENEFTGRRILRASKGILDVEVIDNGMDIDELRMALKTVKLFKLLKI